MLITGRCHCGNISFALRWEPDPDAIEARACTCTFCGKHGGVWTANPGAALVVTVERPADVSRYRFGTRTAEFHICATCGVVPLVTSEIEGTLYAVVSVHAFEGVDPAIVRRAPVSFDGEAEDVRLARRQRNWIPRVEIRTAGR